MDVTVRRGAGIRAWWIYGMRRMAATLRPQAPSTVHARVSVRIADGLSPDLRVSTQSGKSARGLGNGRSLGGKWAEQMVKLLLPRTARLWPWLSNAGRLGCSTQPVLNRSPSLSHRTSAPSPAWTLVPMDQNWG